MLPSFPVSSVFSQLLFLLWVATGTAHAQLQASKWYFGNGAGLDFRSGQPVALTNSAMVTPTGCSSRADSLGNLLMYTDGLTIWNRAHQPMANGTRLALGNGHPGFQNVIVPQPGSPSRYYVITPSSNLVLDARALPYAKSGSPVYYSVVDMSRQGGLGEVVQKNTVLQTNATEQVTAVLHANHRDVWIICLGANTRQCFAYLLTPGGMQATPVTSTDINAHAVDIATPSGQIKASPNGRKLAFGFPEGNRTGTTELLDFDTQTGRITNPQELPRPSAQSNTTYGSVGVEFSPDGTKLYTADLSTWGLYQYDLTVPGYNSENSHIPNFLAPPNPWPNLGMSSLQLGPDGRIYVAIHQQQSLSTVESPNQPGPACNFGRSGAALGGRTSEHGLPFFLPHELWRLAAPGAGANAGLPAGAVCQGTAVPFTFPALYGPDSVRWNFGDPGSGARNFSSLPGPTHRFALPGTYTVALTLIYASARQVLRTTVQVLPQPVASLGPDRLLCPGETLPLAVPAVAGNTYRWQDGSTASSWVASRPGWYWVAVTNAAGCTVRDSVLVSGLPEVKVRLGADTVLCTGQALLLRPRNRGNGVRWRWQDGSQQDSLLVRAPGLYWAEATNAAGCRQRDSIRVIYLAPPAIALGADTTVCSGSSSPLVLGRPLPGVSYRWQDGSTNSTFVPTRTGTYWVTVSTPLCSATDSVRVRFYDCSPADVFIPNIITPNHDGQNDRLEIVGLGTEPGALTIFSRWGQTVYRTSDYRNGWAADGLPDGIYYYYLQRAHRPPVKGWVEVRR